MLTRKKTDHFGWWILFLVILPGVVGHLISPYLMH